MDKIYNLTQHLASKEQKNAGVVDLPEQVRNKLAKLLTFTDVPDRDLILHRATLISQLFKQFLQDNGIRNNSEQIYAMIGGAPYLIPSLEYALAYIDICPLYAFSQRRSVEKLVSGKLIKTSEFVHIGWTTNICNIRVP